MRSLPAILMATSLFVLNNAQAAFDVPAFRGGPNSTYQEWNVFSTLAGPNLPDVANNNSNGNADLIETTGDAFVTGGGNIYSPSFVIGIQATIPDFNLGAGYTTDVVVQIRSLGTEPDPASILFNGVPFDSSELLFTQALGGFGGNLIDRKFTWNDIPGNIASNILTFNAAGSSMSLDRIAIDTQANIAVPEVGSSLLVGAGLGVVLLLGRLRRTST